MQKKLLTVAVASALAMPAVALAQVTVYGTIDGGLRQQSKIYTGVGANSDSQMTVDNGQRTTNRWGLKGSEDLGGGMMANFTLEGNYAADTGNGPTGGATFARKSIVGLSSGGNSVDIGRDYTVNFKAQGIYDPMSYTYTGVTPAATVNTSGTRSSNMVTAGFRFGAGGVRVDYALGERVGESWGTRIGGMGDFAFGPVTVAAAISNQKDVATGDIKTDTMNVGAAYAMGPFTFRAGYSNTEVETGGVKAETPMLMLGAQYAISPTLNGRVGYYDLKAEVAGVELGKSKLMIVALDYSLSKRTTAYVEFDRRTLDGAFDSLGAAGTFADGATGIGAGIVHSF